MGELFTSIDLGTSKVNIIIGEVDKNGYIQIIGVGDSPCDGIKKGVVVDIESTSISIINALEQAENMADVEVTEAYVNIPGGYTNLIRNKGIIAVSGDNREINYDDVKRVLNSATILSLPQDQQIIDIIPIQYIIDGFDEIKDPVGMVGIRLEADVDIVLGSTTTILNIVKSVNEAGIEVLGIIPESFAVSESILSKDEKELGILVIDVGAGTSDFSIFKNNQLIHNSLVPIGGNHITNDISVGLRISFKESEQIKRDFGLAYTPLARENNIFSVTPIGIKEKMNVSELSLSKIIEARIEEILEIIDAEIKRDKLKDMILAGVVITGGGISYFPGVTDLANEIFKLPTRVGRPDSIGIKEPIYSTCYGLVNYSTKRKFNYYVEYNNLGIKNNKAKKNSSNRISSFFKKIWEEYF